jgi:hypothetical protein
MGFLIFLVFVFIVVSMMRNAAQKQAKIVLPPDFFGTHNLPPEHVRQVGAVPAAVLPARAASEESSSEVMWDEAAGDQELNLDALAEAATRARPAEGMSVAARPLPAEPATLETEVDWEAEHDRFHRRYVDARAPSLAAAHGLLDELRDPAGARRAVLLAEILGPPVSMRR